MNKSTQQTYLDVLLQYYEEEVSGESYFRGLKAHFAESDQLEILARVERHAAQAIAPLLEKYGLQPRAENILAQEGQSHVERHASLSWQQFMEYIIQRYPGYLDDFSALENMAPVEDLQNLQKLTRHEVAAIEFAEKEIRGDADSCTSLAQYLLD